MSDVTPLDPATIIETLDKHDVRFVLIGALAARLHGFPRLTADADITPATDGPNMKRLASALRELDAKVYMETIPEGLQFDCSAEMLGRAGMWNLVTSAGRIDVAFKPAGTDGYDDLESGAERFRAYGVTFLAASLKDIIRSKKAANRPKDREDVAIMRAMQKPRQPTALGGRRRET